jgi:mRNA interferase MazF
VVILPFPFDDLSQSKRRPALVVATPPGFSPILAQITSQIITDPYAVPLALSDFTSGGPQKDSYIRANILLTANPAKVLYHAGTVTAAKMRKSPTESSKS